MAPEIEVLIRETANVKGSRMLKFICYGQQELPNANAAFSKSGHPFTFAVSRFTITVRVIENGVISFTAFIDIFFGTMIYRAVLNFLVQ